MFTWKDYPIQLYLTQDILIIITIVK